MSFKSIFSRSFLRSSVPTNPLPVQNLIIDVSNNSVVAIGSYLPAMLFVSESIMDTKCIMEIRVTSELERIAKAVPRSYPEWSYGSNELKKTSAHLITEDMRDRCELATAKIAAMTTIMFRINRLRSQRFSGLSFQEQIYMNKESEAKRLKENGYEHPEQALYVAQYAEVSGTSLEQAAEEILLQATLNREYLAKTERIRLEVYKSMKAAKTVEEVNKILKELRIVST
ncbi:MAG: hypothetical protein JWM46_909 [Candidatus Kaiserbacteria bacterium]|nr:hypothetical protein [Candidatus Kaiserbacteria bacterium]